MNPYGYWLSKDGLLYAVDSEYAHLDVAVEKGLVRLDLLKSHSVYDLMKQQGYARVVARGQLDVDFSGTKATDEQWRTLHDLAIDFGQIALECDGSYLSAPTWLGLPKLRRLFEPVFHGRFVQLELDGSEGI